MQFSTRRRGGAAKAVRVPALRLCGLRKQFGENVVVDEFSLEVARGRVVELIGPRGAGKTTLLAMATGLLPPDEGSVEIFGFDVWDEPAEAKAPIGVLLDETSVPAAVTGLDWLVCGGLLHGMDAPAVAWRAEELLGKCGLTEARTRLVGDYSAGMYKRLCLAAALMGRPELLILDDPFEGVDDVSARRIGTVLREFAASNGAVVLTGRVSRLAWVFPDHTGVTEAAWGGGVTVASRAAGSDSAVPAPRRHVLAGPAMATGS